MKRPTEMGEAELAEWVGAQLTGAEQGFMSHLDVLQEKLRNVIAENHNYIAEANNAKLIRTAVANAAMAGFHQAILFEAAQYKTKVLDVYGIKPHAQVVADNARNPLQR